MMKTMGGYRQKVMKCQVCCRELDADLGLEPMGGVMACPACIEELPRTVPRNWGFELREDVEHHQKHSRHGHAHLHAVVQAILPTEIPMSAAFRLRRGLSSNRNINLGDEHFDDAVQIESLGDSLTRELLSDASVRHALRNAVALVHSGSLQLNPLGITLEATRPSISEEQLVALDRAVILLAICVERWVRGAPGCAPTQPGCTDRLVGGHRAWPADPGCV
jgi:hypothetical protein